ncbi:hypothetical protein ODJ79_15675 [Actinoplanes sp. KI2]|uniref:hypothetical protein n=1 Tax=Actinoplanes sp. KI2 TaxID=2983315 RepID=UPI0021D5BC7D|nr:hypothetical protein [Actinoplanes sp. KI2]MCU7725167.1 hypothetical protein [Actinoplanes sp. KI2]
MLPLGDDALSAYAAVPDARRAEMQRWRDLSAGTDLQQPRFVIVDRALTDRRCA